MHRVIDSHLVGLLLLMCSRPNKKLFNSVTPESLRALTRGPKIPWTLSARLRLKNSVQSRKPLHILQAKWLEVIAEKQGCILWLLPSWLFFRRRQQERYLKMSAVIFQLFQVIWVAKQKLITLELNWCERFGELKFSNVLSSSAHLVNKTAKQDISHHGKNENGCQKT